MWAQHARLTGGAKANLGDTRGTTVEGGRTDRQVGSGHARRWPNKGAGPQESSPEHACRLERFSASEGALLHTRFGA